MTGGVPFPLVHTTGFGHERVVPSAFATCRLLPLTSMKEFPELRDQLSQIRSSCVYGSVRLYYYESRVDEAWWWPRMQ